MGDKSDLKKPVAAGTGASPTTFLKAIKGKPVVVKLNSSVEYRGEQDVGLCICLLVGLSA